MSQANLGFPPDFDKLNYHKLKTIAKRWAGEYPMGFIKSIDLYSYASPYQKAIGSTVPTKYAIVFNICPILKPARDGQIAEKEHYEKLASETEQNFTFHQGYLDIIHADFSDVYKNEAKENFMDEWRFIIKEPGCPLPEAVKFEEPSINLFHLKPQIDPEQQKLFELMKKVRPEIEILYNALKAVGFSGRLVDAERKWKNAVLTEYEKNLSYFQYIKREHLEDNSVYEFTETKARRDFIGKIIQKVISEKGLGPDNYSKLYNIYTRLTDNIDNISTKLKT